jgi:hypothetical protein
MVRRRFLFFLYILMELTFMVLLSSESQKLQRTVTACEAC